MSESPIDRRVLVTYAGPEAFSSMTRVILAKLGYAIVTPREFEAMSPDLDGRGPDLFIVDERSLGDVPDDGSTPAPIIVLTGRHGVTGADPRIAGAIKRPAGMHDLYRLIQEVLEENPRLMPRVPTHIPAHCTRHGKEWTASVLSLSENGCLIRTSEPLQLGSRLALRFEIPRGGTVELDAETAYQLVPDLGLVFHATPPAARTAIGSYVSDLLAQS